MGQAQRGGGYWDSKGEFPVLPDLLTNSSLVPEGESGSELISLIDRQIRVY